MQTKSIYPWVIAGLSASLSGALLAAAPDATINATATVAPDQNPNAARIKLQDVAGIVLGTDARIKAATAERNAQAEKRRGAWAEVGPRVTGDYSRVMFPKDVSGSFPVVLDGVLHPQPSFILRPKKAESASLTVAQPITGAYALVTKAKYEGLQADLKDLDLQVAKTEEVFMATEFWLRAYQAQRQLEIAEAAVAAAESQAKDGGALERAGRINRGDSLKLQLAVSEAKGNVAQAKAGRDSVFAALREALNMGVGAPLALDGGLPELANEATDDGKAVDQALTARVEAKQAETAVEVAGMYKKLAYSQYIPSVSVFAKGTRTIGPGGFGSVGEYDHSYGLTASWDIWSNGSSAFAVREAAQHVMAAEEGRTLTDKKVRLETIQALSNLRASQEALAVAKVGVDQAEEAYRIEQARFRTGTRSATDLVLAEVSRTAAKGRLVNAQTDVVLWHLKTQKALGAEQPKL